MAACWCGRCGETGEESWRKSAISGLSDLGVRGITSPGLEEARDLPTLHPRPCKATDMVGLCMTIPLAFLDNPSRTTVTNANNL